MNPLRNVARCIATAGILEAAVRAAPQHDAHVKAWHGMKDAEHEQRMRKQPRRDRPWRSNRT